MGKGDHPKTFLLKSLKALSKVMGGGNVQTAMWWVACEIILSSPGTGGIPIPILGPGPVPVPVPWRQELQKVLWAAQINILMNILKQIWNRFVYICTVKTGIVYICTVKIVLVLVRCMFLLSTLVVYICTVKTGFVYTCPVDNIICTAKILFMRTVQVYTHTVCTNWFHLVRTFLIIFERLNVEG